ncbi:MAG: hypothetical protein JNK81_03530 [Anaerolineales bacterium]|nr:hypothetical protein [Anaerolineales bacterium]
MKAKFEVQDIFSIIGRGHVILGWVRDGFVKKDMSVSLPDVSRKFIIDGIEMVSTLNLPDDIKGIIGLLISHEQEGDEAFWKSLDIKGKSLDIEDVS